MKISIVTISYNQAEFLERAICSVINQEYPDIEYIIVDPGSTDGSRGIIEKYRTKVAKVIYELDSGPADGLNKGFNSATGDIYGFLNSDDVLMPGALSFAAEYFKAHPDIDLVSGNCIVLSKRDEVIRKFYSDPFFLYWHAYGSASWVQPSTFFRSNIYKKTSGFNISNSSNWDAELFVDMLLQGGRARRVNEILSGYRLHDESITSSCKLNGKIQMYRKNIFRKIIGRERRIYDYLIFCIIRLCKHIHNPVALYERIMKGQIYGRSAK